MTKRRSATVDDGQPPLVGHFAIALVSCAILLFEVAITRLLSVVVWYHFAFLSISLAMLGLGAPGVWFTWRPPGPRSLPRILLVAALAIPLSIAAITGLGRLFASAGLGGTHPLFVGFVVLCILVPMLALGSAVCLLLLDSPGDGIGRRYGADLLGATAGALGVVPLLHAVPTPLLLAAIGLLPLAALIVLHRKHRPLGGVLLAAQLALLLWGRPFALGYNKNYVETSQILFEHWSPTARITVLSAPDSGGGEGKSWGWGLGSRFVQRPAEQRWIDQDGSAGTPIEHYRGDARDIEHLAYDVTGVGYQLTHPRRVCIIGPGGGRDILTARLFGARRIDAVELNPGVYAAMTGPMREFSGGVYQLPGVAVTVAEGRSYLTRSDTRYDLIQISLVDSITATAAGAYALSENYLYTTDAVHLYWQRLEDSGMLSVSRWMLGNTALETPRLLLLIVRALEELGVTEPRAHIAVLGAGGVATVLVSKRPLTAEQISRLDDTARLRGFTRYWPVPPGAHQPSLIAQVLQQGAGALAGLGFDVRPPTDERPFFFQMASPLGGGAVEGEVDLSVNDSAVQLLRWLIVILVALSGLLFFTPFLLGVGLRRGSNFFRGSVYFALIGVGFMMAEVPWIQRFILYLGHPSYATTAVLSALLCGAGLGSLSARRCGVDRARRLALPLLGVVVALAVAVAPVSTITLGWPFVARLLITEALLLPAGFVLGFAFPIGMMAFGDQDKAWFWAVNGAFGVLGSVVSLALAILFGFNGVLAVATCAYLGAVAMLRRAA